MLTILLLAAAFAGTVYAYVKPGVPLHGFLHPAHLTTGNLVAQVIFGLAVAGACIWLGKVAN